MMLIKRSVAVLMKQSLQLKRLAAGAKKGIDICFFMRYN